MVRLNPAHLAKANQSCIKAGCPAPTNVSDSSVLKVSNSQVLKHTSIATDIHDDVSVRQPQCSTITSPASNSFMLDHSYARKQASTDPVDQTEAPTNENSTDKQNGECSQQEIHVESTVKAELNDSGESTEPEPIDSASDNKRLINATMTNRQKDENVADEQGQSTIQQKMITRYAGKFIPGRWLKTSNNSDFYSAKNVKLCHTDERPHECTTCGRRFKRNQDVKRHSHVHLKHSQSSSDIEETAKHVRNSHIGKPICRFTRPASARHKYRIVLKKFQS